MPEIINNVNLAGVRFGRKNAGANNKATNTLSQNKNGEQNLNAQPNNMLGRSIVFKGKGSAKTSLFGKYQNMTVRELDSEIEKKAFEYEKQNGYKSYDLKVIGELENPNAKKAALVFLDNGFEMSQILYAVQHSNDDKINSVLERFFELQEDIGIPADCIYEDFLTAEDKKYSDIKFLFEKYGSIAAIDIRKLSRVPGAAYEEMKSRVLDDNIPLSDMALLAAYYHDEDELNGRIKRFDELNSRFHSSEKASCLAHLYDSGNPEIYDIALKLSEEGFDIDDASALAILDDDTRGEAFKLLDRFNVSDAVKIAESKYPKKALAFVELGASVREAMGFLRQDSEEKIDQTLKTLESLVKDKDKRYDTKTAILLAKLPKDKLEAAKKYFAICGNISLSIQYAKDGSITPLQQGYIEQLLNYGHFHGAGKLAKSPDIEEVLADYRRKNDELKDVMSSDKDFSYEDLSARDKFYLTTYGFESPYYSPGEYVHRFLTYKNMRSKGGFHIFNTEHLQRKRTEDFSEMQSALNDGMLYNNLVRTMRLDPEGKEFDYFSKYLDLIREGLINPSAIRKLDAVFVPNKDGSGKKAGEWAMSLNIKKDIDTYFDVKNNSSNADFKRNLALAFVPDFSDEKDALNSLSVGDVFKLEGEKFIRIVTGDNKTKQLNISRKTYLSLFPPLERFSTSQQTIGDCYCLEAFMGMFCDERLRPALLQTISEDENGDITIKFPNNGRAFKYEKGNLPDGQNPEMFSCGAKGFQLFEHAYSLVLEDNMIKNAQGLLRGEKLSEFNNFITKNRDSKDGIFVYIKYDEPYWCTFKEAVDKNLYREKGKFDASHYDSFNQYLLGSGSNEEKIFSLFNMKSNIYESKIVSEKYPKKHFQSVKRYKQINSGLGFYHVMSYEKLAEDIKKESFFDENIVSIGIENHAYSLSKETDLNGNAAYYLYNPHNQALPVKFDDVNLLTEYLRLNAKSVLITKINRP